MPHPAGSVTFLPGGRFTFCRGFLGSFEWFVNPDNDIISFDGEIFTIGSHGSPNIVQYVQIDTAWWSWSSNAYTLDHLVIAYWYVILPSPTEIPNSGLVIHLKWSHQLGWYVQFQKESPSVHIPFTIETEPGDYWLAPVPPRTSIP